MILSFHPCIDADRQIILGDRGLSSEDLSLIRQAGAIVLPQSCSHEIYRACRTSSAYLFPDYEARFAYPGKVGQSRLFSEAGFSHPETLIWNTVEEFQRACNGSYPHEMPFLLKADRGHEAAGVYIIEDTSTLEEALKNLRDMERSGSKSFISQELIPTAGNVLRVVILGGRAVSYWKRPQNPDQIITSLGKGAKIDRDWRIDLQEKGIIQARGLSAFTGINLAAVDFIFPSNLPGPDPLFLEINYYFGRRGLGGSFRYYSLLFEAVRDWLSGKGLDPEAIRLA